MGLMFWLWIGTWIAGWATIIWIYFATKPKKSTKNNQRK